ncbi:hypothetical protein G6F22_021845 [Rhizopus arrhizus]|nr:hypothetical protein G6F22_021845 [Rhizopus arrhizus]
MAREIKECLAIHLAHVQIAARGHEFVFKRRRHRHDFAGGRDDGALPDHQGPLFAAALGRAHDPRAVLIRPSLHGQVVMEIGQAIHRAVAGVVIGRVVAQHD